MSIDAKEQGDVLTDTRKIPGKHRKPSRGSQPQLLETDPSTNYQRERWRQVAVAKVAADVFTEGRASQIPEFAVFKHESQFVGGPNSL